MPPHTPIILAHVAVPPPTPSPPVVSLIVNIFRRLGANR